MPYPTSSPTPDPTLTHRRGSVILTLRRPDGTPLADTDVTVRQTDHAFGFGNIGFEFVPLANGEASGAEAEALQEEASAWFEIFNRCTLPFYWGWFEPERGRPDSARLLTAARWFAGRGVQVKGHPLLWHTQTAPWLLDLSLEEVERVQRERIRREVGEFAGVIDTWDVVNEAVIMPVFTAEENGITRLCRRLGRIRTIALAFAEARATNPDATLLLNDFDLSTAYDTLLEGVLEAGVTVDALGLQTHMHQGFRGEEEVAEILDRFSRYGLPLHFTETTLVSGHLMPPEIVDLNDYVVDDWPTTPEGEERQADELERFYRMLFAHPAVASITYWGLPDAGAWLGAPAGLLRADGTRKPAYEVLRRLVCEEWRTPDISARTDAAGRLTVDGWRGTYQVTVRGGEASFVLAEAGSLDLVLGAPADEEARR